MTKQELIEARDRVKEEIKAYENWIGNKFEGEKQQLLKEEKFSEISLLEKKLNDCKVLLGNRKIQLNELEVEINSLEDLDDESPPSLDEQSKILAGSGGGSFIRKKDTGNVRRPNEYSADEKDLHIKNKKDNEDVKDYINKLMNKKNK